MSIPTLGEFLAQIYIAQIAQIKGIYYWGFRRRLEWWVAAQGGHIRCKVGPESGAHFFIICATHISYALRRQRHLNGVLRFFWSALYVGQQQAPFRISPEGERRKRASLAAPFVCLNPTVLVSEAG